MGERDKVEKMSLSRWPRIFKKACVGVLSSYLMFLFKKKFSIFFFVRTCSLLEFHFHSWKENLKWRWYLFDFFAVRKNDVLTSGMDRRWLFENSTWFGIFFSVFLEVVHDSQWHEGCYSFSQWLCEKKPGPLLGFQLKINADYMVLLESIKDLQSLMNAMDKACSRFGLTINSTKTKLMLVSKARVGSTRFTDNRRRYSAVKPLEGG